MKRKKTFVRTATALVCATAIVAGLQSPAFAAFFSASSADGYTTTPTYFNWVGTKNIAWTTKLVSRHGSPVYLQVQGVRDNFFDTDWRRMTPNSYSTTGTTMSGRFDGSTGSLGWDGVRFKVCRDINNSPDSCGPATATFPR